VIRTAVLLLLASQLILLWFLLRPGGGSAILFSFAGIPLLVAGLVLLMAAALRARPRKPPGAG
jgi:hypothetical protein